MKNSLRSRSRAFTLIEMLIVIAIMAILGGISLPVYSRMKEKAQMMTHLSNVKNMTMHTLRWAADNSQTLPSPEYPGGHAPTDPAIPDEWDFAGTGSGLWLDGVIYYAAMFETHNDRVAESEGEYGGKVEKVDGENGNHLKDTIFFSQQSFNVDPMEKDMHKHSYAMNKNLQFDYLYSKSDDPYLTNKNLARITHRPSALLFIENEDSNVINQADIDAIIETGEKRWTSKKVISSYLDGSARTLTKHEIPTESLTEDREASRFWRGVDADSYSGE
ncbi:MAG: type II secretion system protein [Verrucomicrobiales bacterium]|nr:type II secretion system protein [Verrucomicrobiales bacterium]